MNKNKSNYNTLSSNRNSFGISLLLYHPSNATKHLFCQFDEESGIRPRCSEIPETARKPLSITPKGNISYVNTSNSANRSKQGQHAPFL